jgi:hypothetical protein
MKVDQATALTLIGWYLMLPPFTGDLSHPSTSTDPSRPLSQWQNAGAFDSAAGCAHALSHLGTVEDATAAKVARNTDSYQTFLNCLVLQATEAQCIATGLLP